MFIAGYNIPGYLPDADTVELFETTAEAWEYLLNEAVYCLNHCEDNEVVMYQRVESDLSRRNRDTTGELFGADGYVYWVSIAEGV